MHHPSDSASAGPGCDRPSDDDSFNTTLACATAHDEADELACFRDHFYVQPGVLYFDGNSLGLLSKEAEAAVLNTLEAWKTHAVDGWSQAKPAWFQMPEQFGQLAAQLIGAKAHETVVAGSTTSNLHTLLATFYHPTATRTKIVADSDNFPSDLYALQSHIRLHGQPDSNLVLMQPGDDGLHSETAIIAAMTEDVALVLLPAVWYQSGQLADMRKLTDAAHQRGVLIGFDLCHSIGIVPHALHPWGVDFAVWCNYKYLNGGPGSTAGLYVHERHHQLQPGLAGWFGSDKSKQFDMAFPMTPAHSAAQWQMGTPPILATASVGASIQLSLDADMVPIRSKSLRQTAYLRFLLERRVIDQGLGGVIRTPQAEHRRGGHIAFEHEDAVQLGKALRHAGVIPDFRPPRTLRFAPVPLYTSYADIWNGVERIHTILQTGQHRQFSADRDEVS